MTTTTTATPATPATDRPAERTGARPPRRPS